MKLLVSFALCQVPFGTRTFYSESSAIWRGEGACAFCLWEFKGDNVWRGSRERWERLLGWGVSSVCVLTELSSDKYGHTPPLLLCLTTLGNKQLVSNTAWQNHTFYCLRKFIKNNYLNVDQCFFARILQPRKNKPVV